MRKPCPNKIALIQRKYLRLILKAAKRRTADNVVIVPLEFTPQIYIPDIAARTFPSPLR